VVALPAVAAAIGAGHLIAGFVSPASSPFVAVGDTVIRLSPPWLTEFAKTTFGIYDKPVLLVGMAVVIAAVALGVGAAGHRGPVPGTVLVVALGLVGVAVVLVSPVFSPADLAAPATALAVGLAVHSGLYALAVRTERAGGAGGSAGEDSLSRRSVLVGSSVAVGVGALAAAAGGRLVAGGVADSRAAVTGRLAGMAGAGIDPAPPIPPGADFAAQGTPTFLTSNADFYRVDVALSVPRLRAEDWSLRLHGMVDREITLSFADLLARPLVERTITLTCVSNEVGGPYISTADFVGVPLRELLLEAGVRPGADQLLSTSSDGWTAGTPVDVLLEPDRGALLAVGMNGEALPVEHGFPVRMVVPGLYGFVSATKWVVDLELTTFAAEQAYWRRRGWGERAPIKTQSRIDRPQPFARIPGGRVTLAGIAWSQPVGISRVEVRLDGGPWREAEQATEVNRVTWRMWRLEVELAPGGHTVEVRATDRDGVTQTEARAEPIPDGATGWDSRYFTVV
jgi:DMSO/TMAO reductase YedYZ molybdopterin-dependent catalytic subunit